MFWWGIRYQPPQKPLRAGVNYIEDDIAGIGKGIFTDDWVPGAWTVSGFEDIGVMLRKHAAWYRWMVANGIEPGE